MTTKVLLASFALAAVPALTPLVSSQVSAPDLTKSQATDRQIAVEAGPYQVSLEYSTGTAETFTKATLYCYEGTEASVSSGHAIQMTNADRTLTIADRSYSAIVNKLPDGRFRVQYRFNISYQLENGRPDGNFGASGVVYVKPAQGTKVNAENGRIYTNDLNERSLIVRVDG